MSAAGRIDSRELYRRCCAGLWAVGILCLPLSSLPALVKLAHASSVAPLTTVLLSLLALAWLAPYVLRGGKLPAETAPMVGFVWVAVFTWALAFFRAIPPFQDQSLWGEARSSFVTLAMGMAVFFTSAAWIRSQPGALKTTLRLVHFSSLPLLGWSCVQAYFILFHQSDYPDLLFRIQSWISASQVLLYQGRATGLAFEPSWLAHQLNVVYLPIWLASSLSGVSVFRRLGKVSVENLLLLAGGAVLFISFSRVGWVSFGLSLGILGLLGIVRLVTWLEKRFFPAAPGQRRKPWRALLLAGLMASLLLAAGGLSVLLYRIGMLFDPRLAIILEHNPLDAKNFYDFANRIFIGERVVYWSAGFGIFQQFPLFGAGVGAAGFYFREKLPAFAWGLVEVQNLMYRLGLGFNIKSLWVRLLAETGLLGFSIFAGWYFLLVRAGVTARRSADELVRLAGTAGLFMLTGFLAEGFSIDSFALPYFWFAAGLLIAAAALGRSAEKAPVIG